MTFYEAVKLSCSGLQKHGKYFPLQPSQWKNFQSKASPECLALDMILSNLLYLLTIHESTFFGMLIAQRMFRAKRQKVGITG
jgi:hypothetical protein